MKTILVPVGSFEKGINTLQYAIDFAKEVSAEIYLIKTFDGSKITGSIKTIDSVLESESKQDLKNLLASVDQKNVIIKASIMRGTLVEAINLFLKNISVDLIISTARRASIDDTVYIGKITGSIIQNVDCPVMVVPATYKFKSFTSVLMAIKSGIIKREGVLEPLKLVQESFSPSIHLLQVITPKLTEEDLVIDDEIKGLSHDITTSENATVFQGVLEHLIEFHPDLLCVIRRKRGFFAKLWKQNTVKKIDFESRIPLLILKGTF